MVRRRLLFAHAREEELLAYLAGTLSPVPAARLSAHLEPCTLCQRALADLRNEVSDLIKPATSWWRALSATTRQLHEPILLGLDALGRLFAVGGPAPLASQLAGATMDEDIHARHEWHLTDAEHGADIHITINVSPEAASTLEIRVDMTVAQGARPHGGRIEILDEQRHPIFSAPLPKIASLSARIPAGRWLLRVSARTGQDEGVWEIPLAVMECR